EGLGRRPVSGVVARSGTAEYADVLQHGASMGSASPRVTRGRASGDGADPWSVRRGGRTSLTGRAPGGGLGGLDGLGGLGGCTSPKTVSLRGWITWRS